MSNNQAISNNQTINNGNIGIATTAQRGYWQEGDRSFANGTASGYAGQLTSSKISMGS